MIVFAHLLNDNSGSPRVLRSAIRALTRTDDGSCLFVGSDGRGVLEATTARIVRYWYRRTRWRSLTLVTYALSQVLLFLRLLLARDIPREALVYVNTLLPFGAAVYGRLTGRRVVYHLHEVSLRPRLLQWLLLIIVRHTAAGVIGVSDFHVSRLALPDIPKARVYNALPDGFLACALRTQYGHRHDGVFRVLMLASLRDYKGVPEFIALAQIFSNRDDMHFDLVANDADETIRRYFAAIHVPANCAIHPRCTDPSTHYAGASLVMNLSRPDKCKETFGLTLLEAMAYGLPVIGPLGGGPAELVRNGVDGLLVDSRDAAGLYAAVARLVSDKGLCAKMSAAARERAKKFTEAVFVTELRGAVTRFSR